MKTDNINSIEDIKAARQQVNNEIELTRQQLDLNVTKLRYQVMPTSMFRSVFTRFIDRITNWFDAHIPL